MEYRIKHIGRLIILTGVMILVWAGSLPAQISSYFKILNGIPHLPVVTATVDVSSPLPGSLVYSTGESAIKLYSGTAWVGFCTTDLPGGTGARTTFSIVDGIPVLAVKTAVTEASEAGDIYYPTTGGGLAVNDGTTSWYTIANVPTTITATSAKTQMGSINTIKGGLVLPVLAADPTGVLAGAFYLSTTGIFKLYNGTAWTSITCNSCPATLTVTHTAGLVAPVSGPITYGVVATTLFTGTPKCAITQNLGATTQATVATDNTDAAAGWYWKFNRKQGYTYDSGTSTLTPLWNITNINETSDWLAADDPCTLLLGAGWRLPTSTEWTRADGASGGNWGAYADAYTSELKLHASGYLDHGLLVNRGSIGYCYSSTEYDTTKAYYLRIAITTSAIASVSQKVIAYPVRCLKD